MIRLIDTHAHLEEIEDLEEALARAEIAGVSSIITVGSDFESNKRALAISGRYGRANIYPALGIHPWGLKPQEIEPTLAFIEENIEQAAAIGEIGLDYWDKDAKKDPARRDLQKEVFKAALELSRRYGKPAIIHARGSWEDALELTVQAQVTKANFHWYSGPPEILERILGAGYFISATPAAAYSKQHRSAILRAPLERLLLETDSPVEYQGERSEPAHLLKTLEAVSNLKGVDKEQVAKMTTGNALRFFDLEKERNHI